MPNSYDVIVVGAGHAGCEAALASARLGCGTAVITVALERIGHMPCNCSIGGPAKGQITREIDAMGGQMALVADESATHIRWVGTGKGPAIRTLRSHADKKLYPELMRQVLENQDNITLFEGMADKLLSTDSRVTGVRLTDGTELNAKAVVITSGTFMNGICHIGEKSFPAARYDDPPSTGLPESLKALGVRLGRFKTGTTPRLSKATIDFSCTEAIASDSDLPAFSFMNEKLTPKRDLLPCWQLYTNLETHQIILDNLNRSALFGGRIKGAGPRFCPSIEDKIVRFADKQSHPVFLEQEEWDGDSIYVQGMSTSLPEEVQKAFIETLPGLKNSVMLRPGYAVEYDMINPEQLDHALKVKGIGGLYSAGQINGSSGYEEAAGQGLAAGINAALAAQERKPLFFERSTSYIGVMIDDLITKGVEDPYRMLTARAEYRLQLRHDNADKRLTPVSREIGLCSDERWRLFNEKYDKVDAEMARLLATEISGVDNDMLASNGLLPVNQRITLIDLLKRSEVDYQLIARMFPPDEPVRSQVAEIIEITAKNEYFINRQITQVDRHKQLEWREVPEDMDYHKVPSLSYEGREKLTRIKPRSIGQASRIPGVRPSDVAVLLVYLKSKDGR